MCGNGRDNKKISDRGRSWLCINCYSLPSSTWSYVPEAANRLAFNSEKQALVRSLFQPKTSVISGLPILTWNDLFHECHCLSISVINQIIIASTMLNFHIATHSPCCCTSFFHRDCKLVNGWCRDRSFGVLAEAGLGKFSCARICEKWIPSFEWNFLNMVGYNIEP